MERRSVMLRLFRLINPLPGNFMTIKPQTQLHKLISSLEEKTKELNCLYLIEEILHGGETSVKETLERVVAVFPTGMQYPEHLRVRISLAELVVPSFDLPANTSSFKVEIYAQEKVVGSLKMAYAKSMPQCDEGPFLRSEIRLANAVGDLIGHYYFHQQLRRINQVVATARENVEAVSSGGWRIVLNLINRTDPDLFLRVSRKMNNYLCWKGIREAEGVIARFGLDRRMRLELGQYADNKPHPTLRTDQISLGEEIFEIAAEKLPEEEILQCIERWTLEDKSRFLVKTLVNRELFHPEVFEAIRRFKNLIQNTSELSEPIRKSIIVALIDRFLSNQLEFIKIAKNYIDIDDFSELIKQIICTPSSRGALGGKGAGLFLAFSIIRQISEKHPELSGIKLPKTWYITSDGMYNFLHYNNIEEVTEQKYKAIDRIRREYPNIVFTFKNSYFPPELIQGFNTVLDDLGDKPLIVRSSSLLEDRFGAAFSGKYVSLFLANQGSREDRLNALMDAIAEVYASVFNADPLKYRSEKGLLDFNEEMGVLIQEVVGTKVGTYFLPSFAGVAFSNNEFRWSNRIKREDGLVRLVMGLGTRAVDRLGNDYTILVAPGKPNLNVNATGDEKIRYAQKKIDLINLETNTFETVEISDFVKLFGNQLPGIWNIVSIVGEDSIRLGSFFNADLEKDRSVVTFDGLFTKTTFLKQMKSITDQLQERLGTPVDIEFASDGKDFYLLQCRPQGHSEELKPAKIPHDLNPSDVIFTANRFVSNGSVPDITHIVYVSPERYSSIESLEELHEIGRAISKLNSLLPKRHFILMGPGRWGSRGDVKLGVGVTYSDICNTAMLIEIGRAKGDYIPDLSFGTHFFQDLVESQIRYLPLYPDNEGIVFNEVFLTANTNLLPALLPEEAHLAGCIFVTDVGEVSGGKVLKVFMNAENEEAVGVLSKP